jgi:AcrR family transcriptional regulator
MKIDHGTILHHGPIIMSENLHVKALGLRERGKREKLRRIKRAAREVFRRKGYEAATTREIADRAQVAYGTLFIYARDKRDLLMMLVNDDLDALTEPAFEAALRNGPLIKQLVAFFHPRFAYWAQRPEFSRYAVWEMFEFVTHGGDTGAQAERFRGRRSQLVAKLAELVRRKQASRRIERSETPEMIAWLFMAIYLSENRKWLEAQKPDVRVVKDRLRRLLRLAIKGIALDPAEWGGAARRKRP